VNDDTGHRDDHTDHTDTPIAEIRDLSVDPHPDLEGRVIRDINRRTLVGDSLDFSLNVMVKTFWEHLQSLIDAWPGHRPTGDDRRD
jgi:hypothetical protein